MHALYNIQCCLSAAVCYVNASQYKQQQQQQQQLCRIELECKPVSKVLLFSRLRRPCCLESSMHASWNKQPFLAAAVYYLNVEQDKQLQRFFSIICSRKCRLDLKLACSKRQAARFASFCMLCSCSTARAASAVLEPPLQLSTPSRIEHTCSTRQAALLASCRVLCKFQHQDYLIKEQFAAVQTFFADFFLPLPRVPLQLLLRQLSTASTQSQSMSKKRRKKLTR